MASFRMALPITSEVPGVLFLEHDLAVALIAASTRPLAVLDVLWALRTFAITVTIGIDLRALRRKKFRLFYEQIFLRLFINNKCIGINDMPVASQRMEDMSVYFLAPKTNLHIIDEREV